MSFKNRVKTISKWLEKDMNLDILKHQQFSGSELIDTCLTTALGNSYSTQIQGDDSTEHQFKN
jgi:isocitrate lyase